MKAAISLLWILLVLFIIFLVYLLWIGGLYQLIIDLLKQAAEAMTLG